MKNKRLLSIIISLLMCFSLSLSVHAQENGNRTLRYGERYVTTVLATEWHTVVVTPCGQPPSGFQISSGGGIYVNTDNGITVGFSIGATWGKVDLSVSAGTAGLKSSIGGILLNLPNTTDHFIAKINKTYKFEHKKVDEYRYNELINTYYITTTTLDSINAYVVRV